MGYEILINARPAETRVAYLENGILLDLVVERKLTPTLVGSIYKGKIIRILPGMQAAFVDIGLDRAAFLYVGDVRDFSSDEQQWMMKEDAPRENSLEEGASILLDSSLKESDKPQSPIQDLLEQGQYILVQIAKDPLGTKGARVTTHISLPGRHVVYLPTLQHLGISRRIEDENERQRLRDVVLNLKPKGGVIVRTAGEGATNEDIAFDLDYLDRVWKEVERNYEKRKTVGLIHSEPDIEVQVVRDLLNDKVERVLIDDRTVFKRVDKFINQFIPKFKSHIVLYDEEQPLFDQYDIEMELSRSMGRKIWLKSGGYIVFDEAEALVVIDVNTGRFVGKKDLEDTILKTNLEAVREIAHQLRIRNCGGIIIIDFIDLEKEIHREMVFNSLKEELSKDRARTNVLKMSELGLVEMTRKRIRPSLVKILCEPCSYCEGKGYNKRFSTVAHEIFREIEREGKRGGVSHDVTVLCQAEVTDWIYESENEMIEFLEKKINRHITFKVETRFHIEQYEICFT